MAIYLGIDGGGTKTTCVVGDDNAVLDSATAGGSNIIRSGQAQARESLHQAIRKACTAAQVDPKTVAATCIGVAGAGRREVSDTIRRLISEVVSGPIEVVGDATSLRQVIDNLLGNVRSHTPEGTVCLLYTSPSPRD